MLGYPQDQPQRAAALSATRYAELALPDQPRFAPWIVTVDLGDGRLQFRSSESAHTLNHPLLVRAFHNVEKLLDGQHTVKDIVSSTGTDFQPTTVIFLLKLLHGKGLLQHGEGPVMPGESGEETWERQVRFLSHYVPNAALAQRGLAKSRIGVVGSCGLRQAMVTAFRSIGINRIIEMDEPSTLRAETDRGRAAIDLVVACEVAPGFDLFNAVNDVCLATKSKWLRVAVSGTSAQLGPTVVPYETACYTCLELRRQAHEPELDGYLAYRAQANIDDARDEGTAPLVSVVSGQVALEITRMLTGNAPPATFGRYYEFSAGSPAATPHEVLRVPRCPSCSTAPSYPEAWDQTILTTAEW